MHGEIFHTDAPVAAALGTLQGSIKVTPTEFAAATLDLLDKTDKR